MKIYNILILEDVPFDVELMEREIKKSGINFTSRTVELEEDFLREIKEFKPDLILADHSLPHFDGLSAMEIAKRECPDVPFIFVSGTIGEEFAVDALKNGAKDYVLKSNLSKVVPAIKRALEEVKEQEKRKKAEEALVKSHWQLREAQKIGHIGSWEWDIQSDVMDCSDEFYRISGLDKDNFIANYNSFMSRIHIEDREVVSENINSFLDNLKRFSVDYRIIRPNGDVRFVSSHGEVIHGDNGEVLRVIGTEQDITRRKIGEDKLKQSLKEKELLLQEIHHRVKNNLQVISSLLRLQSYHINDPDALEIFRESQNRVSSIALVHEKLYQSQDRGCIDFADYLKSLTGDLFHFFPTDSCKIKLKLELDYVKLNIETAISCGLIVNELLTNSLKHAFSSIDNGEIYVGLTRDEENNKILLVVADNGAGLPSQLNLDKIETFGLELVHHLSKRINGEIKIDRSHGTRFEISLQELNYRGRLSDGE